MDDKTHADWGETLRKRFPGYESDEFDQAWDEVKQRLEIGRSVTGVVVARAPFGAWIDFGVGFPGLLEITRMSGLSPESYQAGDWSPIGSQVTAFVSGFKDAGHQIGLSQTA